MKTFGLNRPFAPEYSIKYFVGREGELDLLEKYIFNERKRIIAISGNNATGKTSLWKTFFGSHKEKFDDKIEVIRPNPYFQEFPKIGEQTQFVIIEDISFEFTASLESKISNLIREYPLKQFMLIGTSESFLNKFNPDEHIHLGLLPNSQSTRLLLNHLEKSIPEKDLLEIVKLTNGHPFLLRLIANYLNENNYNLQEILKLINESVHYKGVVDKLGQPILETGPRFEYLKNDIRIVNKSLLDKIRMNPKDVYNLTPRQFEEMVAELMSKRGYQVDLTKATRDGGKDLIIANHSDIGNFIYYVECKKYASTNPVGVNLVRELAGTILTDRVTAGIMITSSYFSPDAITFSEKISHQMSLIDFIHLKEWLRESS